MIGVLEAILAVIGVLAIIAVVACWNDEPEQQVFEEDLAAPYREALHAAIRMQAAAQDLEQQIYVAAARHAQDGTGGVA